MRVVIANEVIVFTVVSLSCNSGTARTKLPKDARNSDTEARAFLENISGYENDLKTVAGNAQGLLGATAVPRRSLYVAKLRTVIQQLP